MYNLIHLTEKDEQTMRRMLDIPRIGQVVQISLKFRWDIVFGLFGYRVFGKSAVNRQTNTLTKQSTHKSMNQPTN